VSGSMSRPAGAADADSAGPTRKVRPISASVPGAAGGPRTTLSVQAVFHGLDERRAQAIAADLIDRAHELANEAAGECDVDVSVQLTSE
jgi:DNA-binding IclR family transcriptional regulator